MIGRWAERAQAPPLPPPLPARERATASLAGAAPGDARRLATTGGSGRVEGGKEGPRPGKYQPAQLFELVHLVGRGSEIHRRQARYISTPVGLFTAHAARLCLLRTQVNDNSELSLVLKEIVDDL